MLPLEFVSMILELLRHENDFDVLYQCAISSKCFTEKALMCIYQYDAL